jgi:hypothetical protein
VQPAFALDWMDNAVGYRFGTRFAEPYNPQDIRKHVVNLTHASGYAYGGNYMNLDILKSDHKDDSATEAYLLYRHTWDIGKLTGKEFKGAGTRGLGFTAGFDWNHKNDKGYASRKQMLVAGPTLMVDVPGFLNISLLALWESNDPIGVARRYRYDTHAMLNASWGIPVGGAGNQRRHAADVRLQRGGRAKAGQAEGRLRIPILAQQVRQPVERAGQPGADADGSS